MPNNLRILYRDQVTSIAGSSTHPAKNDFKSQTSTGSSFSVVTSNVSGPSAVVAYLPEETGSVTMTVSGGGGGTVTDNTPTTSPGKYLAAYLSGGGTSFTVSFSKSVKVSRILIGSYWTPRFNVGFGMSVGYEDATTSERLQGGDIYSALGPRHKTLQFNLEYLTDTDKFQFFDIIRTVGSSKSLFISLFPKGLDKEQEQMYSIYGKLTNSSAITYQQYTRYSTSLDVEEF
jgi:hypothetical protein